MFLHISQPSTDEELFSRTLAPYEPLDCDYFARRYANTIDANIAPNDGWIPDGCGDIRVEIRNQKNNATVIWNSAEYFLEFVS
jgi:hypothetical protein